MNTPITIEEAAEHLSVALKAGNAEDVAKWDFVIRSENDFRVRNRTKQREMREQQLEADWRRSLKSMF